jgi:hypothetical protein
MGLVDTLVENRQNALKARVFHLGLLEHYDKVMEVLSEVMKGDDYSDAEMLSSFLISKDHYVLKGGGQAGFRAAVKQLKKLRSIKRVDKECVLALVMLDAKTREIQEYPTPEEVLAKAETLR